MIDLNVSSSLLEHLHTLTSDSIIRLFLIYLPPLWIPSSSCQGSTNDMIPFIYCTHYVCDGYDLQLVDTIYRLTYQ